MKRKLTFGIVTLGSLLAVLPLFSAFEAHVINVVAQIENALYVHPESRNFGTVFPQEYREMGIFVTFSESFSASDQTRVSKVDYDIKQKPKPRPLFEEDIVVEAARLWCHDNYPIAEYDGNAPEWQEKLTRTVRMSATTGSLTLPCRALPASARRTGQTSCMRTTLLLIRNSTHCRMSLNMRFSAVTSGLR